jgi:hypothetical protein
MQTLDTCSPLAPFAGITILGDMKLLDVDCHAFVGRLERVSFTAISQESRKKLIFKVERLIH